MENMVIPIVLPVFFKTKSNK